MHYPDAFYKSFGQTKFLGLPMPVCVFVLVSLGLGVFLSRSKLSGQLYAAGGFCQTDENRFAQGQESCSLRGTELTPLGKSGGAVGFEIVSRVEMTLLVEMIADRGVDGDEFL